MARVERVFRDRAFWVKTVRRWRGSGESQRVFAARHGLAPSTLGRWAARVEGAESVGGAPAREHPAARFVEVVASETETTAFRVLARIRVGAVTVELGDVPPAEYVAAVASYAQGLR